MSEWKEISNPGDVSTWKPEEVNESIEGTLVRKTRDVGQNKSTIYEIMLENNELCAVWETAVLKSKVEQVPDGSKINIVYLGKKKSQKGPGVYKDFKVMFQPPVGEKTVEIEELPF